MKRLTPTRSALIRPTIHRSIRGASVLLPALALVAMLGLTGCPAPVDNPSQGARLTMLLSADGGSFAGTKALEDKARVIEQTEINSLLVNLDEIRLTRTIEGGSEVVTAFSDPIQINLLDLVGVNDVLDSVVVPEGDYTSVQIILSAPQLTLASDPATVIDAIALPDGGSLTVNSAFSASSSDAGLLVLQLGSISLVSLDDGTYQLVPDLQVELVDTTVEAQAIGIIHSVDATAGTFLLKRDGAEVTVNFDGAQIFKPSDFDTASGSAADLAVGLKVFATGTLSVDGNLMSDLIVIFSGTPTHTNHESLSFRLDGIGTELNARGEAEYETEGDRSKLDIEVEGLTYTGMIDIVADGVVVATADSASSASSDSSDSKDDSGKFEFRLDTRLGDEVPVLTAESSIELRPSGTADVLLSGTASISGDDDSNGDDNGGDNSGSDDSGVDDNGGDNSGSDDSGVDDNGGDNSGSDDSGADDNGGDNSGSDDSGVDDNGGDNSGSDDSGADDNGGDNSGSDDNSADDNSASVNGSDDTGVDDNGGDTVGSDDSGVDDNGGDTVGSDDTGADDNGGDTVGSDDTGADDNGGDTVGSDDTGVDDNGGDTVGSDDTGVDDNGGDAVGSDDTGVDDNGGDADGSDDTGVDDNGGDTVGSDDTGVDDNGGDADGSDDNGIDG